ncbi:MAG: VOC family protein [Promethearchaeota archaeon]
MTSLPKIQYPMTFLPCRDLAVTRDFYNGLLKLQISLEQGPCVLFQIGEGPNRAYWGFCSHYTDYIETPKRVCLTLVVDSKEDVDAYYEMLSEAKIECIKKPAETPQFQIYNTFFKDTMGYSLEIQMFYPEGKPKGA